MKEAVGMLDDVVVIGYGTQKRGNLTGSIASVSGKILEKVQTTSAAEAIVGKLPDTLAIEPVRLPLFYVPRTLIST